MIQNLILILLLSLFSGISKAYTPTAEEKCTAVDLRTDFPLKMREQGDVSWCYAHASADHLQYYFKIPEQISAADIALIYNAGFVPRMMNRIRGGYIPQTGFAKWALKGALENGYCPESIFPSAQWKKVYPATATRVESSKMVSLASAFQDISSIQQNVENAFFRQASDLPFYYQFKNVDQEKFFSIVARFPGKRVGNELMDALRVAACSGSRKPYGQVKGIGMRIKGKNTFRRIGELFSKKVPASVDFFDGFLVNLDHFKFSIDDLHTTLLMGRRFDRITNQCQYLIKNSYGSTCRNSDGTERYDSRIACEAGYLWVPEDSLYHAMTSYVYVKDPLGADSGPDFMAQNEENDDDSATLENASEQTQDDQDSQSSEDESEA